MKMEDGKNKCGQVAVDKVLTWILVLVIAGAAGYAIVKAVSSLAG